VAGARTGRHRPGSEAAARPACLHGRQREAVRQAGRVAENRSAALSRDRGAGRVPPRIDTPRLFSGERGGYLDLHWWRAKHWSPAVRAAGFVRVDEEGKSKPTHSPYSLRHTYASWAIAAGIGLFELSRLMGTSVEQIDGTYGHLLPDSLDRARTALGAFGSEDRQARSDRS
jgi:integrase